MASNSPMSEETDKQLELLELIKNNHDEAYLYVSQGLAYQEQKQYSLATDMYRKGLDKINAALDVRCDKEYCKGPKWDNAKKLQEKMKKTSQLIRSQLQGISFDSAFANPPYTPPEPFEMPPSYDEACEHDFVVVPRRSSYPVEVNGANHSDDKSRRNSAEVAELFCVPEGVQLFFVSYDGSVTTNSTQTSLYVYQFIDNKDVEIKPPAWLQIGSWTYPLIPGQSPALESSYGAFLFPNVGNARDSAVGVVLPPSVSSEERAAFLQLLHQLTALKEERRIELKDAEVQAEHTSSPSSPISETISKGIVTGAEYLSAGIVKGAALSSDLIHKGATKARQRISPEDKPVVVDPRVREGLRIAHEASGCALKATGYLVRKLGDLTVSLGRQLAPHIREQSTKLLTSAFRRDPADAKDTVDGVLTVAAGGLQGFSTIYMGLENAARMLAYSLSAETVNIVGHKYGGEAGEVVGDAVSSIGNLALTTHNVQSLGVKSIAKKTAKDTGKAILKDYSERVNLPDK
ncbi:spartin isoform X2 [Parasteatoda tepidariorum]|nr:spartin isoform X2 [Parasteatoda tepidariorum]